MSISRRVAEELKVTWGREVGCKMRFNDDTSRDTQIKFMTDGILLAEIQSVPLLRSYSALIIDEANERSLNIDFLLGYLQGLLKRRTDLKLIITSATIDTEAFSKAFGNAPIIEVSGRTYPVEVRYRPLRSGTPADSGAPDETDDEEELEEAIVAAAEELWRGGPGDILVFLPGEREDRETAELARRVGSWRTRSSNAQPASAATSAAARVIAPPWVRGLVPSGAMRSTTSCRRSPMPATRPATTS